MAEGRQLRVAVPAAVREIGPHTGAGKMWRHVLAGLEARVDLKALEPSRRRPLFGRAPDVWVADCGLGPIEVTRPVVVQVHEAGWDDRQIRDLLDPQFLEVVLEGRVGGAVRVASQILTPSESARWQVIHHWDLPAERVHAVPHGVDVDAFKPDLAGGPAVVEKAGGRGDVPYVLFVSQLHPRKNLSVLREAMIDLTRSGFPHQLVIVGAAVHDRADWLSFQRAAEAELPGVPDRVFRLANLPEAELAGLMAGAAAFCLPSLMEGFGMTVLEAMSCGTPVVTSDRGSLPEVVGKAGLVVPPTVEAVRDALAEILSDSSRAAELGAAARQRALSFTWD